MPAHPLGRVGDVEQIDVCHAADVHRHQHVAHPVTVNAVRPSAYPSMGGRNVDYHGGARLRLPHILNSAMPGYFSATPGLPSGYLRCQLDRAATLNTALTDRGVGVGSGEKRLWR